MASIADLFISVSSDVSGAITGLTSVDEKVNGTSAAMQSAVPAALALAGAATAVGGAFLSSISTAADFEHQMSGVKAVMTPDEVIQFGAALSDLAIKLGKDTVFTSEQAAAGIEDLIKAGVSAKDVLGGAAEAAVNLAAATGTTVANAADIAAKAMNTFGLTTDELGKPGGIVDFFAGTVNATAADMDSLRLGLSDVGSVAATFGLSLQDTAEALGIMANNGLTAQTAGTALKTMLLGLIPTTNTQTAEFNKLNLETFNTQAALDFLASKGIDTTGLSMDHLASATEQIILGTTDLTKTTVKQQQTYETTAQSLGILNNAFFDSSGKVKDLAGITDVLNTATAGMSDEQKIAALNIIFGSQGMQAAAIIANQTSGSINTLHDSITSISAADAAKMRLDNLQGSMMQLGGSVEAVQIQIGTLFLPVLRSLVDTLTSVFNAFLTLGDTNPTLQIIIVAVVGVAGALAALVAGFVLLGPIIASSVAAFGIIAGAIAAAALPITLIIAAAALLYAAWQDDFGGIREVTEQVWQAIQPGLQNIRDFITLIATNLGPAFQNAQTSAGPFIEQLSQALAPLLARLPDLIRLIGDGFNALSPVFQAFAGFLGSLDYTGVANFFAGIGSAVLQFLDVINKLLSGDFQGAWESLWGAFTTVLSTVFTAQGEILQAIGGAILNFLQQIPGIIAANAPGLWQAFLDEVGRLPDQLAPYWQAFLDWFGGLLGQLPGFIADAAGDIWAGLTAAFGALVPQLAPYWDNFAIWFGSVLGGIPQFVVDGIGDVFGGLVAVFGGLIDLLSPYWDQFAGWLGSVLAGIPDFVANNMGDIWGPLVLAAQGLVGLIGDILSPIKQIIIDIFGAIPDWFSSAFGGAGTGGGGTTGTGGGTVGTSGGGPLVYVGTLIISSQDEANAFLDLVAQAVLASAQRVTVPVTGGNPVLA